MARVDRLIYAGVIAWSLLMASCAPGYQRVWSHPGSTSQLWARDSYECERQAQVSGMSAGMSIGGGMVIGMPIGGYTDDAILARCLEARGWR